MDEFPAPRLDGKVAIVTGGGGGLGSLAARAFAAAGADVVLVGRTAEKLRVAEDAVRGAGRRAAAIVADVTRSANVNRMVEQAVGAFGRVDILLNNAGVTSPKTAVELTDDDWHRIMDTSATGAFYCARAVAPVMMRQREGCIISVGSILSARGMAKRTAYSAAKAAVMNLTRALALELGPHGIRVNAIAPTVIVTDLNRELVRTQPQLYQAVLDRTPLGRLGEPEDIAGALVFLASPAARFITGQTLFVDGGYTAS
ncbi:MAG TPA: glucose 1-dehydrogenase [Burkholderiales bacterium]|nr:glucose 1-dehydrogenase [Burkholderiales bacterium]